MIITISVIGINPPEKKKLEPCAVKETWVGKYLSQLTLLLPLPYLLYSGILANNTYSDCMFFISMVLLRIPTAVQPMTGIEGFKY